MDAHTDYDGAPEGVRWPGKVADLFEQLHLEAYRGRGRWVAYILPIGVWVQVRVRPEDFRYELRLARRALPDVPNPGAIDHRMVAWQMEVRTILHQAPRHASAVAWFPTGEERVRGGVVSTFLSLFPSEVEPGQLKCECGTVHPTAVACSWCATNMHAKKLRMVK